MTLEQEPKQSSFGACDADMCKSKATEKIEMEGFTVFQFCKKCAEIFRENE